MAGRGKSPGNLVQTGIINFIHKKTPEISSPNSANKRPLTSPDTNIPPKKRNNMITMDKQIETQEKPKPQLQLPPELQLLYDSLSDKIDKIDRKIPDDFNLPKHTKEVEEIKVQVELKSRLSRVEGENESLK